jgi:hypothetical protein
VFHEIAPSIRLTYDSSVGNGAVGLGWSFAVGSRITRTSVQMGVPRHNADDQLRLDGMELQPCKRLIGVRCQAGGTHTTRVENFQRIRQDEASVTLPTMFLV